MRSFTVALLLALAGTACTKGSVPHSESAAGESAGAEAKHSVPALVASFDPSAGELPEGLLITADSAYVGFAPSSRIVRVDVKTGKVEPFAELPAPIAGKGFMTGLARSASGDVYAGLASFVPEVQAGIYRVSARGGKAELFAKDAALPSPMRSRSTARATYSQRTPAPAASFASMSAVTPSAGRRGRR